MSITCHKRQKKNHQERPGRRAREEGQRGRPGKSQEGPERVQVRSRRSHEGPGREPGKRRARKSQGENQGRRGP
jgi:hypothetical protein